MKRIRIIVGASTIIGLFLIGLTIQAKTTAFFKNLWSTTTEIDMATASDQEQVIQLALLLDTSGSMNGLIEQAKSQLWKIVNELGRLKANGETPNLEIALFEYGTDLRANGHAGWLRQVSDFTKDMDKVSGELFALTTGGSHEYCGLVLQHALNDLAWSQDENSLKLLYIAGNETFDQGAVDFRTITKQAKSAGVFVNTIFCGNQQAGINLFWQTAANFGGGDYSNIDQDQATVYIKTPFDQHISDLNIELNDTYIAYGEKGAIAAQNQKQQDTNAGVYSQSNIAERAIFKSSKNYSNEDWDLVDAYKKDKSVLKRTQHLSADWQQKSPQERESAIKEKLQKRTNINQQIQELNRQRQAYITKKTQENGVSNSLENSISKAIEKQAGKRGFVKEVSSISISEMGRSEVDYPAFSALTHEVEKYREKRMLNFEGFLKMMEMPNTLILDTRSKQAYDGKHLKGAIHLNFSDFTAEKLAAIIPSKDTRILIYCNNNFLNDAKHFAMKSRPLALNIPTFINLYGYGYKNVYELAALVPVDHQALEFEGNFK